MVGGPIGGVIGAVAEAEALKGIAAMMNDPTVIVEDMMTGMLIMKVEVGSGGAVVLATGGEGAGALEAEETGVQLGMVVRKGVLELRSGTVKKKRLNLLKEVAPAITMKVTTMDVSKMVTTIKLSSPISKVVTNNELVLVRFLSHTYLCCFAS